MSLSCHVRMAAVAALLLCAPHIAVSQSTTPADKKLPNPRLFRSEEVVNITLSLNMRQIKRDKGDDAPWRDATIRYKDAQGKEVVVPLRARTRGVWRLQHCDYPPLRLKFGDKKADGTLFANLDEPKLVTYCRNLDNYESYVLQEAQLYRIYRLLTDASFKIRVLRIAYADSASGKVETTRYSFLIEDFKHLLARMGGKNLERMGAIADDLSPRPTALAQTFLYFVANTDVSFNSLHNSEIVSMSNGDNIVVPYDFDMSGVINAVYATVDPKLPIKYVRTRIFRGFCEHLDAYPPVFDLFRAKRSAIEALYADDIGKRMSPSVVKSTLKYYAEFYDDIATPASVRKQLFADCVK
ncbi:MAG: hypothetical protein IBJ03_16345 [Gemmatimonadaceae bacterium]|nr:hypothetical protein [Gemmatimonadaceae bacterium]